MWTTTVVRKKNPPFPDCWLQPFITSPRLSDGTTFWLTCQGKGYLLVGAVSSWRCCPVLKKEKKYFFVKSQKTELALQFYFCIDVWLTSCVTLQESLLFLHWCYTQRKTYAVLWGVLYSIHIPTSISVLCSVCFILNTWHILLKYFMSFSLTKKTTQPYDTWGLQLSPLRGSKRGRESRLMERLRRWKAE